MHRGLLLTSIACIVVLAGVGAGCERALFPEKMGRSPYERYQTLRGQNRPAEEQNAYGGDQPALRQRLRPMGRP